MQPERFDSLTRSLAVSMSGREILKTLILALIMFPLDDLGDQLRTRPGLFSISRNPIGRFTCWWVGGTACHGSCYPGCGKCIEDRFYSDCRGCEHCARKNPNSYIPPWEWVCSEGCPLAEAGVPVFCCGTNCVTQGTDCCATAGPNGGPLECVNTERCCGRRRPEGPGCCPVGSKCADDTTGLCERVMS
jgi:hypothetical protein